MTPPNAAVIAVRAIRARQTSATPTIGQPPLREGDAHTDPRTLAEALAYLATMRQAVTHGTHVQMPRDLALALLHVAHAEVASRAATVALLTATPKQKASALARVGDAVTIGTRAVDDLIDLHVRSRETGAAKTAAQLFGSRALAVPHA